MSLDAVMSMAEPTLNMSWMRGHSEPKHTKQHDMKIVVHDPADDDCPPEVVQRLRAPVRECTQIGKDTAMKRPPRSQRDVIDDSNVTLGKRAVGNNPEHHVWSDASRAAGARRRRLQSTALLHQGTPVSVLPLPSPVHALEWWRRPPSPLVWHMRPLWAVASVEGRDSPERRAPEDGEQPTKLVLGDQVRCTNNEDQRSKQFESGIVLDCTVLLLSLSYVMPIVLFDLAAGYWCFQVEPCEMS